MKVVYVGNNYGTCLSRYHALQKLVSPTEFFSIDSYFAMGRWHKLLETMTFSGPRHRRANRDLLKFCAMHQPDVVWIDKSIWVWPSTLKLLRAQGAFLVHHFTDAIFPRRWRIRSLFRLLRMTLPLYDLNFTSNVDDHTWMLRQSGIRAELTYLGYDAGRYDARPLSPELAAKWSNDLLFIGHYEPRTERGILSLIAAGIPVKVYGDGWHHARSKALLQGTVQFKPLTDEEYIYALKGAKIGLCFVSELNYNQTAGRSFEIPASGTFLLAIRTPQHSECYREGEEAEFFSDTDELVRKARYYLENDAKREQIARRGHERCVQSDYSWERYMRDDWGKVLRVMNRVSTPVA